MYSIKMHGGKELTVGKKQKETLSALWDTYLSKKVNRTFSIEDEMYKVSDIKSIEKSTSSEKRLASGSKMINDSDAEFEAEVKRFLALPVDKKVSGRRSFMDMAFTILSGNRIPEEHIPKVKEMLFEFYKANPNRLYPDMVPFRDLMVNSLEVIQTDQPKQRDEIPKINTLMAGAGFLKVMLNEDLIRASS